MASLLPNTASEYCQNRTLRDRRASFNPTLSPKDLLSHFRSTASQTVSGGPAVVDDSHETLPVLQRGGLYPPTLSRPSDAHVSGQSTNVFLPRHQQLGLTMPEAPPTTGFSHRRPSFIELGTESMPSANSLRKPERVRLRLASAFLLYFLCGWGDGVTGTVLPYFTEEFHLTHMTSSLLFAGSTCGFLFGTLVVERVTKWLGLYYLHRPTRNFLPAVTLLWFKGSQEAIAYSPVQARYVTLLFFGIVHSMFFVMMGSRTSFAVMFLAYAMAAFARSFWTATLNVYLGSVHQGGLGYAFGLWGFGSTVSPLVCQTLIAAGVPWPHFYFGSLVVAGVNLLFISYAFRPTIRETYWGKRDALASTPSTSPVAESQFSSEDKLASSSPTSKEGSPSSSNSELTHVLVTPPNTLHRTLCIPYQWAFSIFLGLQTGNEAVIQGFMVTYLLAVRQANPDTVGYATSGFWGGMTLARFVWGYYTPRLTFTQRKYIIHGCLGFNLVMNILIWFVNSNVGNSLFTGMIGLSFGPLFPGSLALVKDILPPEVHMVSMALLSASSSLGAAIFPFVTGTVSNAKGVQTMTYVTVAQAAVLFFMWFFFPSHPPAQRAAS